MAANPLIKVPAGLQVSPAITPGAVLYASAGMGGSSAANQAALLQQQVLAQQYGTVPGAAVPTAGSGPYAPSPLLQDPLFKLAAILSKVISYTDYEMVDGARELCNRVNGTMSLLSLPPSADDKAAMLRLAWRCRAILPPELATYAALGGGTDAEGAEPEAAAD